MPLDVAVIGSLNHDITVLTSRHPRSGETVLGSHHYSAQGGKGANQAVAAARLGSTVAMFGCVGQDEYGSALRDSLESDGIDVSGVIVATGTPTGLAVITVDSNAENTIVVSPGANMALTPGHIAHGAKVISSARVVLAQLEVRLETVVAAVELATGTVCLNPAPVQPLPPDLLRMVDVLVPNRSELGALAGVPEPVTREEVEAAAFEVGFDGAVVVTLGADGAMLIESGSSLLMPAPQVEAIDPTGAGDAFCGALANGLARGIDLEAAVESAVVAGAIATTSQGAQPSMPSGDELDRWLNRQ